MALPQNRFRRPMDRPLPNQEEHTQHAVKEQAKQSPTVNLAVKERYNNKVLNMRRIAEYNRRKVTPGTLSEVSVLDSDVLMAAPKGYFDTIQAIAMRLVDDIQSHLSRTNKSSLIAKLKADPTDLSVRTEAFQAINLEYLKYDGQTLDKDYRSLDELDRLFVLAMTVNEICGLGPLEPLYRDTRIKEIICDGPNNVTVELEGLRRVRACKFVSHDHLQELINRLYASVNREVTRTSTGVNARLFDKSRTFAVHQAVAPDGPNLNIRRHPQGWFSPEKLVEHDSVSEEMLEWLGNHIHSGYSFIVNGGTGTGKTTTLSALLGFYPNNKRIVSIEKNLEIKIPDWKMHAAPLECIPQKHDSSVYVTMRDLVEYCTQMRPDMIVCGEIIDGAAYDYLQAGNTGHQVATTLHSNNDKECIQRLTALVSQAGLIIGKETLTLISAAVDFIVTLKRFDDGSRKIISISEVSNEPEESPTGAKLSVRPIWVFEEDEMAKKLKTKATGQWKKVGELSQERAMRHNLEKMRWLSMDELLEIARPFKEEEEV